MALYTQKINFLENEVKEWKQRYNSENKELSEIKTEKIHLQANIDKLKTEIKNLKNKLNLGDNLENSEKNLNMTITGKSFYNGTGRIGNKLLVELMTGQNSIKDFLDEIKNNTEKILDLNKNILNNIKSNNQLKEELEEKEDDKKFKNKKSKHHDTSESKVTFPKDIEMFLINCLEID